MINLPEHLEQIERHYIKQALIMACGVQAHAAELLHLNRSTLIEKMRKHEITWQAILAGKLLDEETPGEVLTKGDDIEATTVELRRDIIKQVMKFCDNIGKLTREKIGDCVSKID